MGATMSAEAIEARRAYQRQYLRENRDRINARRREWRADNKDKVRQYNKEYWERVAGKTNSIRASWSDYGITPERQHELTDIVRSGQYDDLVFSAALAVKKEAAEHIIRSIKECISYEHVEFDEQLGRCPLGRSDFYGARRLFFHYLDIALRKLRDDVVSEIIM